MLKRKRATSIAPSVGSRSGSQLPPESINPLSHPPLLLKQFTLAGYPDDKPAPSEIFPGFPHRPLPAGSEAIVGGADENDDDGNDDIKREDASASSPQRTPREAWERTQVAAARRTRQYEQHLSGLLGIIRRNLAPGGDVARAKRAFGLVLRREIKGRKVDLRHGGLWAIGAEILLREGELDDSVGLPWVPPGEVERERTQRLRRRPVPTRATIANVRDYYECLIRQYPYSRLHRDTVSALQLYPALFATEMDYIYRAHQQGLEEASNAMDIDYPIDGGYDGDDFEGFEDVKAEPEEATIEVAGSAVNTREDNPAARAQRGLRADKERLRKEALARMRDLSGRIVAAMQDPPYSGDHELLRLRAMMAMYMGDLSMPARPRTAKEEEQGRLARDAFHDTARRALSKIVEAGGELDEESLRDFFYQDMEGSEEEG